MIICKDRSNKSIWAVVMSFGCALPISTFVKCGLLIQRSPSFKGKARDLNTFTPVGKGVRRLVYLLHRRPAEDQITSSNPKVEARFMCEARELFDMRHQFLHADFVELQLHGILFCLCELDKYLRAKTGDGKPKRRYGK